MMFVLLFFVVWTILWSLWSVLLYRLDKGCWRNTIASILFGRSLDQKTQQPLWWTELIPIYSRITQKGKSKKTGKSISSLYLVLEITCGIVVATTYALLAHYGLIDLITGQGREILVFWIITNWLLTLLLLRDVYTMHLHMPIRTLTAVWISGYYSMGTTLAMQEAIISLIILVCLFLIIYFFAWIYARHRYQKEEGLGEGDIWLAAIIGALFPFIFSYNKIELTAFSLAYIVTLFMTMSAITGLFRYAISKTNSTSHTSQEAIIPFFPSMIIAYWALLLSVQYIR